MMSQVQGKTMPMLEQILWLAGCTTLDGEQLIPRLRNKCVLISGAPCWGMGRPNAPSSSFVSKPCPGCNGRGWVLVKEVEAWWTLWLWVERQISKRAETNHAYAADVGSIYVRQEAIETKLVELAISFVLDLIRRGKALAPKEEAHG